MERRRFKQTETLSQRLTQAIGQLRAGIRTLAPGRRRETWLRKVRQDETAMQVDAWISSPGLRAPT